MTKSKILEPLQTLVTCWTIIVPGIGQLCTTMFGWSTTFPCACGKRNRESNVCEQRITVSIMGCEPLAHHILSVFDPEAVSGFLCEQCRTQSCATHPAIRRQTLLSLPRFLRINVTAPLTPDGFPMDFHQHGPFREFERLDLSRLAPSPQCEQAHYTLRAAIMYSKRHLGLPAGPRPHLCQ